MSGIFDQIINYSPPLIVSGTVNYKGTWDASTNNPPLSNPPVASTKGDYYVVSTAGTQFSITFGVGDWIISNGTAWEKVDLTDAVSSVFGRTGAVVGVSTDYSAVGLTNTAIGASNPSSGAFTTVTASSTIAATGTVTGSNLSGTNTGDQTTISGNAGSATILQTARNINGVSFNGSADITVTAAAGTLTGATLASGVTASSLTSLGTIASLVATTADINGGTIDGTTIGATTPSTVAATTGTFSGKVSIDGAASTYQLNVRRAGGAAQLSINIDGTSTPTIDRAIQYYAIGDATNVISGHVFYARNNNATDVQAANITSTGLNSTAIGATTASTGAFTTLSATRGSAGVVATLLSGNAAQSPFISFGRASEDLRLQIAAATNDLFTGTVAGDFAINSNASIWFGTAGNPIAKVSSTGLAVTGALENTIANSGWINTNSGASNKQWRVGGGSSGQFGITEVGVADRLIISAGGATALTGNLAVTGALSSTTGANFATSSGNVGIGTSSPVGVLNVHAASSDPVAWITRADNSTGISSTLRLGNNDATYKNSSPFVRGLTQGGINQYNLTFGTSNGADAVERLRIDYTGNVGIGTATPGAKLDVNGELRIGNTVNTVSPTSPNRTVTIVIGGTTYYLAAKTTND